MSGFKREIKLFDAVMMVVGTMIGSGIFNVTRDFEKQELRCLNSLRVKNGWIETTDILVCY